MQFLQKEIEDAQGVQLFRDVTREKNKKDKKWKQLERVKRSIMVLS